MHVTDERADASTDHSHFQLSVDLHAYSFQFTLLWTKILVPVCRQLHRVGNEPSGLRKSPSIIKIRTSKATSKAPRSGS
jgi:hypothetical protein